MNAVTAMATFVATSVYNDPVISSNDPDRADKQAISLHACQLPV